MCQSQTSQREIQQNYQKYGKKTNKTATISRIRGSNITSVCHGTKSGPSLKIDKLCGYLMKMKKG